MTMSTRRLNLRRENTRRRYSKCLLAVYDRNCSVRGVSYCRVVVQVRRGGCLALRWPITDNLRQNHTDTATTPHRHHNFLHKVWCGCGACGCGVGVVWAKVVSCGPP